MGAHPVTDPLAYLAGTWRVHRTMRDLAAGRDGSFQGLATIEAHGAGLLWREAGMVRMGGHEGPAGRVLRVVPAPEGGWEVLFDDGRPFHPLDLRTGACDVVHLCGRDRYEGTYRALGAGAMSVAWRVRGPAKDLEMVSRYSAGSSVPKYG